VETGRGDNIKQELIMMVAHLFSVCVWQLWWQLGECKENASYGWNCKLSCQK